MTKSRPLESRSLTPAILFCGLTYAISWGWSFALLAVGDTVYPGSGWPTHFPALYGPFAAAFILTGLFYGRAGVWDLTHRIVRWRIGAGWWLAALSPLAFLGVGLAVAALVGSLPRAHEFALYSGWPSLGIAGAAIAALVNGIGEETGWRGFLLPSLQPRFGAQKAAVIVGVFWALWHLPYFFLLSSDHGMAPFGYVGFTIAIISGSIVATWLYYGSGQSVLAVAVWHGAFNMAAGTAASSGLVATVASMLIIVQAVLLVRWQVRAKQRRRPPVLGPRVAAGPAR